MGRPKKVSQEDIYKILLSYIKTHSYEESAKKLNMLKSTVEKVVEENKDSPEFSELIKKSSGDFVEQSSDIINYGMQILNREFKRAVEREDELDALIYEVTEDETLLQREKKSIIDKLDKLKLEDIRSVTGTITSMYDKRALSNGDSTENKTVTIKLPEDAKEYAG